MLDVFRRCGMPVVSTLDGGVYTVTVRSRLEAQPEKDRTSAQVIPPWEAGDLAAYAAPPCQ